LNYCRNPLLILMPNNSWDFLVCWSQMSDNFSGKNYVSSMQSPRWSLDNQLIIFCVLSTGMPCRLLQVVKLLTFDASQELDQNVPESGPVSSHQLIDSYLFLTSFTICLRKGLDCREACNRCSVCSCFS
jgi:hypothetical protein